jgi:hypothetical protein
VRISGSFTTNSSADWWEFLPQTAVPISGSFYRKSPMRVSGSFLRFLFVPTMQHLMVFFSMLKWKGGKGYILIEMQRLLMGAISSDDFSSTFNKGLKSKGMFPLIAGVRTVFLTTDKYKK